VRSCPVPCFIASDVHMKQECLDEVDGFIFHPPTVAHRPYEPLVKKPHQQWILFSTESELNYPMLEGVKSCRVCVRVCVCVSRCACVSCARVAECVERAGT